MGYCWNNWSWSHFSRKLTQLLEFTSNLKKPIKDKHFLARICVEKWEEEDNDLNRVSGEVSTILHKGEGKGFNKYAMTAVVKRKLPQLGRVVRSRNRIASEELPTFHFLHFTFYCTNKSTISPSPRHYQPPYSVYSIPHHLQDMCFWVGAFIGFGQNTDVCGQDSLALTVVGVHLVSTVWNVRWHGCSTFNSLRLTTLTLLFKVSGKVIPNWKWAPVELIYSNTSSSASILFSG